MSVSMQLDWSVALRRCAVMPPKYFGRIDELLATGKYNLDDIPQPPTWSELPMLAVADLLEEQELQTNDKGTEEEKKLKLPPHWNSVDVVVPVFPLDCGSMRLYVTAHHTVGTIVGLKGTDIRTGYPTETKPIYKPRQNAFWGDFDIGGTVVETSDEVLQWLFVPPSAAAYDLGRQVGVSDSALADGFSFAFFAPRKNQKLMSIGSGSTFYGAESMRSLAPMAMSMPASKSVMAVEEVYIAPGGAMSGSYPDDPSKEEGYLQDEPYFGFWVRLVKLELFNFMATTLKAPIVEQKAILDARKAQKAYEQTLGIFLNRGVDTGTDVRKRLRRVPGDLVLDESETGTEAFYSKTLE